jgi:hypothetical protein
LALAVGGPAQAACVQVHLPGAGFIAGRLEIGAGAGAEGPGEEGLVHLIEHLRAGAGPGLRTGAASTDPDGHGYGADGVDPAQVEAGLRAQADRPLGPPGPLAAALEAERAAVRAESLALPDEGRALARLRAAAWPAPHPYGHDPLGAPDAPGGAVGRAQIDDLERLDARALQAAPRLCLLVGPIPASGAPTPLAAAAAPAPALAQTLGGPRGSWRVWATPPAAHPDAAALRLLGRALRAQGRPALWWSGRLGGVFALGAPRRGLPRRGLLRRPAGPPSVPEGLGARLWVEQARLEAHPARLAAQAGACWRAGRDLRCGREDADVDAISAEALAAVARRWLPGAALGR